MSFYNIMFGTNPASDVILATLGLDRAHVGRFRDCWVEQDNNIHFRIVVYTRNGGGNKDCWCAESWGVTTWANHFYVIDGAEHDEEHVWTRKSRTTTTDLGGVTVTTGEPLPESEWEEVREQKAVCNAPNSDQCSCPGCIATYILPAHPLHLFGSDDDFDSTYRTEYFSLPGKFREELEAIALDKPHDPNEAWLELIEGLRMELELIEGLRRKVE